MAWKRRPADLARRYRDVVKKTQVAVSGVTQKSLDLVGSRAVDRMKVARRVSRQDNPRGRDLKPASLRKPATAYRLDDRGVTGSVEVFPFWTGARSKAIRGVYGHLNLLKNLQRSSLLVISAKRRGVRARDARKAENPPAQRRLSFGANPQLRVWAERADKGRQIDRHSVYVTGQPLRYLVLGPALRRSQADLLAAWREGLQKGFL